MGSAVKREVVIALGEGRDVDDQSASKLPWEMQSSFEYFYMVYLNAGEGVKIRPLDVLARGEEIYLRHQVPDHLQGLNLASVIPQKARTAMIMGNGDVHYLEDKTSDAH